MTLRDRLLDVAVYAPAGILASVLEDLPGLAAKGRGQIEGFEGQVRAARGVGAFTVAYGRQEIERRVGGVLGRHRPVRPRTSAGTGPAPDAAAPPPASRPPCAAAGPGPASPGTPGSVSPTAAAADAAIPGYDALSASQVVRRLDGLGADELDALYRHETAGRGRRTILHRIQQLRSGDAGAGDAGAAGSPNPAAPS